MTSEDPAALHAKALAAECPGLAGLIEFITSERKAGRIIRKIGSATIDFHGQVAALKARPHTEKDVALLIFSLPAFHFGRADGKQTPLQAIANFVDDLEGVPLDRRRRMDEFFADLTIPQEESQRWKVIRGRIVLYEQAH